MKIFTKKSFIRKIAIICLFLTLFNFSGINQVQAENDDSDWGGKLLGSTISLFVALADGVYSVANKAIMGNGLLDALQKVPTTTGFWQAVATGIVVAIGVVVAVVVGVLTGSLVAGLLVAGAECIIGGFVAAIAGGRELVSGEEISGVDKSGNAFRGVVYKEDDLPSKVYLPFFSLHLGSIFAGDILLFDVNFFEEKKPLETTNSEGYKIYYYDKNGNGKYDEAVDEITSTSSASSQLRGVVSSWYYRLRNISIIASMLVLIYIGIRIIFSSLNPNDKAKYKNMLVDWIVSICLIFCMHYIMLFSVKLVEYATNFINSTSNEGGIYMVMMEPNTTMKDNLKELGFDASNPDSPYFVDGSSIGLSNELFSFPTNMFGYIRMMAQFSVGFSYVGYAVIYIICVLFIIFFSFTYLRRVLYMAFLTMIAPLVALTYPIDKINDGKAQAFNMWFKEYIFNLLIQPMHMLLYFVLVSSAFQLASENFLYAIVAISFMIPAEKIVRKFFGFDKAQTPGLLAGAGGAALAMTGLKSLNKFAKGGKGPDSGEKDKNKDPKFKQTHTFDDLADDVGDDDDFPNDGGEDEGNQGEGEESGEGQNGNEQDGNEQNQGGNGQNQGGNGQNQGENGQNQDGNGQNQGENGQNQGENGQNRSGQDDNDNRNRGRTEQSEQDFSDSEYSKRKEKSPVISKKRAFARVVGKRTLASGKKFVRSLGKTGIKMAGGAVFGIAGGIIGAATGNVQNVMSYATTGGAVGSAIGERAYNDMQGTGARIRDFKQEVANETNDDDVRNEFAKKQFLKDKEARKIYEQKLGITGINKKRQINEAMEKAFEYKKYGVKDDRIIADAMKEKGLGSRATDKKRIMAAKIAEKVNGSQKTLDDQMKGLKERKHYSTEQINRLRQAVANIDGNVT